MSVLRVLARTDYSVLLEAVFGTVPGGHAETKWQLDIPAGDFSAPKIDTGWIATSLTRKWLTGLPTNTILKARAKARNAALTETAWTDTETFRTRRMFALGGPSGFDSENLGTAPDIVGTFGSFSPLDFTESGWPELVVPTQSGLGDFDLGWRARMFNYLGLYDQTSAQLRSICRFADPLATGPDFFDSRLHHTSNGYSAVMVCTPEMLSQAAEMFGGMGKWTIYYNAGGLLGWHANDALTGPHSWLDGGPQLVQDAPNLIVIRYREPQWTVADPPVITRNEICDLWLNNVYVSGDINQISNAHVPPDGFFYHESSHTIDVGHASNNVGSVDAQASGGTFLGIISEFAYWRDGILTESRVQRLWEAFNARDRAAFDTLMLQSPAPIIRDRYDQPKPPDRPVLTAS